MESKSINCNSCGAGLPKPSPICKCAYCGNYNKVLHDGKTVIIQSDKQIVGNLEMVGAAILGMVFPIVLLKHYYRK